MKHKPRCQVCKKPLPVVEGKVEHWHCKSCRDVLRLMAEVHGDDGFTDGDPHECRRARDWRRK